MKHRASGHHIVKNLTPAPILTAVRVWSLPPCSGSTKLGREQPCFSSKETFVVPKADCRLWRTPQAVGTRGRNAHDHRSGDLSPSETWSSPFARIMLHEHLHVHDEHHQHQHEGVFSEPHSHAHEHSGPIHEHQHVSDMHHRHSHRSPDSRSA